MNRSRTLIKVGLVAVFALFAGGAQAQNLLLNGNFSTGSLAPWVAFTTADGTNGQNLPNVVFLQNTTGSVYAAHFCVGQVSPDGQTEGGGIDQTFNVTNAGTYNFFANIASRDDGNGLVNADAGTFSIIIDGATAATDAMGPFSSPFQILRGTLSGSVTLAAGSHTFAVQITRIYGSSRNVTPGQVVTNISLAPAPLGRARYTW